MTLLTETVTVKWNGRNRKHYESLGYKWTKRGNEFVVLVEHLTKGSEVRVKVKCDYCEEVYSPIWKSFLIGRKTIEKDACGGYVCRHMKRNEIKNGFYTTVADVPELLKEWHESNDVNPSRVLANSNVKYKWKCSADESHEWEASVTSRTNMKSGCPHCAGRFNEPLSITHSHLVAEWCKSNEKKPTEVTAGSEYRAKWKCSTCSSVWQARVLDRTHGSGCPKCSESKGEKLVASLLENLGVDFAREVEFPAQKLRGVNNGYLRYDIAFFHANSLAGLIEIDGEFHRRNVYGNDEGAKIFTTQQEHDRLKDEFAYREDIPLFRIKYSKGAFKEHEIDELKEFVESCLSFEKLIQSLG